MTKDSPCCHGRVICLSVYGGPDLHFGSDPDAGVRQPMLWMDTMLEADTPNVSGHPGSSTSFGRPCCSKQTSHSCAGLCRSVQSSNYGLSCHSSTLHGEMFV